jgi:hypothetical protein
MHGEHNAKLINTQIHIITNFLVVLYGCETWSLTLSKEHGLSVFDNRVLRQIFRPKRVVITGDGRKLQNEEPDDLHSSPNPELCDRWGMWHGEEKCMQGFGGENHRIEITEKILKILKTWDGRG